MYETLTSGAQVLIVQSNNATYGGTGQIEQQFAITRARAMEARREIAVATTNSVSGYIDRDGRGRSAPPSSRPTPWWSPCRCGRADAGHLLAPWWTGGWPSGLVCLLGCCARRPGGASGEVGPGAGSAAPATVSVGAQPERPSGTGR